MPEYVIQPAPSPAALPSPWDGPFWSHADVIPITHFHPASAATHPRAEAKVLYDPHALYLHFRIADQYVRATFTEYQSPVCQDSCAEFFVQPAGSPSYFNFEINPIGTLLLFHVTDPTRLPGGALKEFTPVPPNLAREVQIHPSLTTPTEHEISTPLTWSVQYRIPFTLFDAYLTTPARPTKGTRWRANFYKCGDQTSRPHWAAWSPIGDALNFHQPKHFGDLVFG